MSWMDRISHVQKGEHPMLSPTDKESKKALAVMANAGALFSVYYPPSAYKESANDYG